MRKLWVATGILSFWLFSPFIHVYLRLNARTRVIVESGNKILIVKPWLGTGAWELPGGGLHLNEKAIGGAIRETYEETGIELKEKNFKLLGKEKGKGFLPYVVYCYHVKLFKKPAVKKQFVEIIDIKWVDRRDLEKYPLGFLSRICIDLWRK